jgi:hypothetical protein
MQDLLVYEYQRHHTISLKKNVVGLFIFSKQANLIFALIVKYVHNTCYKFQKLWATAVRIHILSNLTDRVTYLT